MKTIAEFCNNLSKYISLTDFIFERQLITFGTANAYYNQCIILAGGAASGKGTIQKKIDANAKVFDVDELKQQYRRLAKQGKINDKEAEDWDFANSSHTADAHQKVKDKGWKGKIRQYLKVGKDNPHAKTRLPNIIFDMVCGDISDIKEAAQYGKELGYTVTIVWVVTNSETAKVNNACRGIGDKDKRRSVPDKILIDGHKNAYKTMTDFLSNKYPEISELVDYAWIGWGTGVGHKMEDKYIKSPVDKVKKNNKGEWEFNKSEVDVFLSKEQPFDWEALDKLKNSKNEYDKDKFNKIIGLSNEVKNHYDN